MNADTFHIPLEQYVKDREQWKYHRPPASELIAQNYSTIKISESILDKAAIDEKRFIDETRKQMNEGMKQIWRNLHEETPVKNDPEFKSKDGSAGIQSKYCEHSGVELRETTMKHQGLEPGTIITNNMPTNELPANEYGGKSVRGIEIYLHDSDLLGNIGPYWNSDPCCASSKGLLVDIKPIPKLPDGPPQYTYEDSGVKIGNEILYRKLELK